SVRLAVARMLSRLSSSHLATPATSRCATACSHSARAIRRQFALRFKADNSKSASDCVEHSSRYSSGGKAGSFIPLVSFCVLLCLVYVHRASMVLRAIGLQF